MQTSLRNNHVINATFTLCADDPSWPIESATYPNFTTGLGPYYPQAVYSIADQQAIQQYAWERGIMVLIELDMPGLRR